MARNELTLDQIIHDYANDIASQAEAVANGTLIGPRHMAAVRILDNAKALLAFIDQADGWQG